LANVPSTEADAAPLIMIANDQEWTARAVESILESAGYRVAHAYTAREVLTMVAACDPDLLILDQQLPDFSGADVCRELRADPRFGALLPIIITTAGPSGRPQRLNAYAAGAWEFYGQPLDAEALLQKISVYLAAYRETRRLRRSAMIDDHTGLYSRPGLARRATELIAEARRVGRAFACIAWSIPGLESAEVMVGVAAAFRASGRAADALAHLGGGTLAVVAPGTNSGDATRLAERMGRVIATAAGITADRVRAMVIAADQPESLPSDGDQLLDQVTLALAS
jgi:PleD family two-component response regulator